MATEIEALGWGTLTDWLAAIAAVATVAAAIAAAISAKASSDTARILRAEHQEERARRDLEPLFEVQGLLGEFLAKVVQSLEGSPTANELQRRVRVVLERTALRDAGLPKLNAFADAEVALVEQARRALQEVTARTRAL